MINLQRSGEYRVTTVTDTGRLSDITKLGGSLREVYLWAHLTFPDMASITIEAPKP